MPAHLIAAEGPQRGLILNLESGEEWTIGRDPDTCDLVVEDSTVSRKHARLNKTTEGVYLKNLSRVNPTLINEAEKTEPVLLQEGDRIQVGNTVFVYSEEAIPDLTPPPKKTAKKKKKSGYDDIFGDIEPPEEAPPEPPQASPLSFDDNAGELRIPPSPPKPEMTAYDTIFEDTGGEEELPFHLISETPLMLKVISGPNAGAEIGIDKGRIYTIGKDPNSCDIVFQDISVSRNHARLEVNDDGVIEIEDLGSKNGTVINGSTITEKKQISPQDLVSLGTTVFMMIDREAPQETLYSPIMSSYEQPPSTESQEPEEFIEEEKKEEKTWKKDPIPTKYLVAGGSAAAIFLIMFLSFFSLFKSNGIEMVQKEPITEIKEALAKFTDVQFSYNPGSGRLFLVGHVLTPVDYQEMKYRLGQINFIHAIEDNVVIDEGVWKMMNDIISNTPAWRGVSIHSPSAGKFVANGYIPSLEEANQLYEYFTVNFPYLDRLENNVVIEQTLNAQLQALIGAQSLGAVTFQLTNGNVILSGMYNQDLDSEFKKLLKEINAVKGITSVKNFAIPTHPSKAGIDLTQQYQITGTSEYDGRGYSAIMNGKIYTLGDQVDGMKITAIEPSTILLEKDGLKYKIDYTR